MTVFVKGRSYKIVANTCDHEFRLGQMVVCMDETPGAVRCRSLETGEWWYVRSEDVVPVVQDASGNLTRCKVYAVVHKDTPSKFEYVTGDREWARECKAEFGGKAAGYIILQFGAEKEIR